MLQKDLVSQSLDLMMPQDFKIEEPKKVWIVLKNLAKYGTFIKCSVSALTGNCVCGVQLFG